MIATVPSSELVSTRDGGYALVANIAWSDSCLRTDARVVVLQAGGDGRAVQVRGVTRGGRVVTKWVARKRLDRVRVAWIASSRDLADFLRATRKDAVAYGVDRGILLCPTGCVKEGVIDRGWICGRDGFVVVGCPVHDSVPSDRVDTPDPKEGST